MESYMPREMTILGHLHFDFFLNRWRFLPPELLLPSQALPQKNNDIQNRTAKNIRALSCNLDSLSCQPVKRKIKLIRCRCVHAFIKQEY
uniref:Uncharacterized protein n=1 Tax=Setaria italica TaxID=4555 RepID=K4AH97_SETIT